MNLPPSAAAPTPPSSSAPRRNWPRLLVNAAVTLVVLAVAAATFVLSYAGVHAIALQGGVSVQLARIYPGVFDAVLVIACVAAVVLRDGRWWARAWAWLVVIVVLGAIGATDVLHAMNYALRHRLTEGVVAAAPVVGVLLAFSLLLTVLRQTRPQAPGADQSPRGRAARRAARQSAVPAVAMPIDPTPIDPTSIDAIPVVAADAVPRPPALAPRPPAPPAALPPAPAADAADAADQPEAGADHAPDGSTAVAETQEIPVLADYASDVDEVAGAGEAAQDLPDPAAPTREEAALSETAPAAPDSALTPDAPTTPDAVEAPEAVEALDVAAATDAGATTDPPEAAPEAPYAPAPPDDANPPTERYEAVAAEAPSPADVDSDSDADADADEPGAESSAQAPRPTPQAIRYASSAAAEYWESEVDPDLAGQVYPVLTSDPDIDTSGYPDEPRDVDDTDAPPFATAPFAAVPRLNRMRVAPIPPNDSDDEN